MPLDLKLIPISMKNLLTTTLQLNNAMVVKIWFFGAQRSLCVSTATLSHLRRISHEGSCPGNGRCSILLAPGIPGSKANGPVSPSQVDVWVMTLLWRKITLLWLTNATSWFNACCTRSRCYKYRCSVTVWFDVNILKGNSCWLIQIESMILRRCRGGLVAWGTGLSSDNQCLDT